MKKKLVVWLNKKAAECTLRAAKAGAGFQSILGWYQPKVPKRIAK